MDGEQHDAALAWWNMVMTSLSFSQQTTPAVLWSTMGLG